MNNPLVSVIIPTYNEQAVIAACIDSLRQQSYKPLEIIVVDDGSKDRTQKIVKKMKGIHLLIQDHLGPGAARNKGAKKAKGEILVFIDADMTFDTRFIQRLSKPIRDGKAIGTFSKEEFVVNPENRWSRCWSQNRGWPEGKMHPADYPDTQKVFRAIRRDAFEEAGGFDAKVGYTDDWTLSEKLGKQAIAAHGAIFFHRNPATLKEVYLQAKWLAQRPYKLGVIGRIVTMLRTAFPISILVGTIQAVRHKSAAFLVFRLVFDLARFTGVTRMFLGKPRVK